MPYQSPPAPPAPFPSDSNVRVFSQYAGADIGRWQAIVGYKITHSLRGEGIIQGVRQGQSGIVVAVIHSQEPAIVREYSQFILNNRVIFLDLMWPAHLNSVLEPVRCQMQKNEASARLEVEAKQAAQKRIEQRRVEEAAVAAVKQEERRRETIRQNERRQQDAIRQMEQQRQEALAAKEFADLKIKYGVAEYKDASPASPLFPILLQMEDGELVEEEQKGWLDRERLFGILARCYQNEFAATNDGWKLAKASGYWRQANAPDEALRVTAQYLANPYGGRARLNAAVHTTRGGAYRDLEDFEQAEISARQAIAAASNRL